MRETQPRPNARLALLSLVVVGYLLTGCGDEPQEGQAAPPKQVADDYLEALRSGDGEAACAQLTPDSVAEIEDPSAEERIRTDPELRDVPDIDELPVGPGQCPENQIYLFENASSDPVETDGVKINGSRATVDVEGGGALVLQDVDGQWKIDLDLTAQHIREELAEEQASP